MSTLKQIIEWTLIGLLILTIVGIVIIGHIAAIRAIFIDHPQYSISHRLGSLTLLLVGDIVLLALSYLFIDEWKPE